MCSTCRAGPMHLHGVLRPNFLLFADGMDASLLVSMCTVTVMQRCSAAQQSQERAAEQCRIEGGVEALSRIRCCAIVARQIRESSHWQAFDERHISSHEICAEIFPPVTFAVVHPKIPALRSVTRLLCRLQLRFVAVYRFFGGFARGCSG
jgi:hypothetical protein